MPGPRHIFFNQNPVITKRARRFTLRRLQGFLEIGGHINAAHPLAATASDSLDQNWIADFLSFGSQETCILIIAMIPGHNRHIGLFHQGFGCIFKPHRTDRIRRGTDENNAGLFASLRKCCILRQKTIARMNCLSPAPARHIQNDICLQIALSRRRRTNVIGLIRQRHVGGRRIRIRENGNRSNAHFPGGTNDTAGDLAAVCNQY